MWENQKQRLSSQNPKLKLTKGSEKQRRKERGRETEESVDWKAQRKSKDGCKGESEEAAVGIESDGRRKEIADKQKP